MFVVTELRKHLLLTAAGLRQRLNYMPPDIENLTDDEKITFVGTSLAANYAYTLAAVLRLVQDEHGDDAAARLANKVNQILADGDENDLNGDVDLASGRQE